MQSGCGRGISAVRTTQLERHRWQIVYRAWFGARREILVSSYPLPTFYLSTPLPTFYLIAYLPTRRLLPTYLSTYLPTYLPSAYLAVTYPPI